MRVRFRFIRKMLALVIISHVAAISPSECDFKDHKAYYSLHHFFNAVPTNVQLAAISDMRFFAILLVR